MNETSLPTRGRGSLIDLTGQKFGRWNVIEKTKPVKGSDTKWLCKCDCGVERTISSVRLRRGYTLSCGCLDIDLSTHEFSTNKRKAPNFVDITGKRYGKLVVVSHVGTKNKASTWLCKCDCGAMKVVGSNALRGGINGGTKSCGCLIATGPGSRPSYKTKNPAGIAAKNAVLKQYKLAAKKRDLVWELTNDEFYTITCSNCVYCGIPPSTESKISRNGSFIYNGIDRVDNTKGYMADNVVPCCSICNHAKHVMSQETFLMWINRLVSYHLSNPEAAVLTPIRSKK